MSKDDTLKVGWKKGKHNKDLSVWEVRTVDESKTLVTVALSEEYAEYIVDLHNYMIT